MVIWFALKLATGRAWGFVRTIPPLWLVIALLSLSLALTWLNASGWKAKYSDEHAAHVANVNKLIDSGKRATAAQQALINALDVKNLKAKDTADAKLPVENDRANAAARDYISVHRPAACSGGAIHTDSPQTPADPQVAVRPDPASVLVSEADVMVCTANTTRLLNAKSWAESLK